MNAISGYPVNDVPARGSMLDGKDFGSPVARTRAPKYVRTTFDRRQRDCGGWYSDDGRSRNRAGDHVPREVTA